MHPERFERGLTGQVTHREPRLLPEAPAGEARRRLPNPVKWLGGRLSPTRRDSPALRLLQAQLGQSRAIAVDRLRVDPAAPLSGSRVSVRLLRALQLEFRHPGFNSGDAVYSRYLRTTGQFSKLGFV
jgi:hypothetical protein